MCVQIQTELGPSHFGIINAREALLTDRHLCLVLEFAAGGSLTNYVSQRWQHAQHTGVFLTEDEARYFFRVSLEWLLVALGWSSLLVCRREQCHLNCCIAWVALLDSAVIRSALKSPYRGALCPAEPSACV